MTIAKEIDGYYIRGTVSIHSDRPGDQLMLHLDDSKTYMTFENRHRRFHVTAQFIEYRNGNAFFHANKPINRDIEVPLLFTAPLPTIQQME